MGEVAGGHVTTGEGSVVGVDEFVTTDGQVGHVGQVVGAVVGGVVGGHVTTGGQVGGGGMGGHVTTGGQAVGGGHVTTGGQVVVGGVVGHVTTGGQVVDGRVGQVVGGDGTTGEVSAHVVGMEEKF